MFKHYTCFNSIQAIEDILILNKQIFYISVLRNILIFMRFTLVLDYNNAQYPSFIYVNM